MKLCLYIEKERGHIRGPSLVSIPEHGTLDLTCDVTIGDKVVWFFKKQPKFKDSKYIGSSPHLELDYLQGSDTGSYYCYGKKGGGNFFIDKVDVIVYGKFTVDCN